jgi:phosphonate transport system substrate-binding protein
MMEESHMFKRLSKAISLVFALLLVASFAAACTSAAPVAASTSTAPKLTKLVIAYLPNEADEKLSESRQGFAKDLSAALGIPVEEYLSTDYNATVEAMRTGKADVAFFGPLSFVEAVERANAEPLCVSAVGGDKKTAVYHSVFIVNAKLTNIKTIKDIKGSTFAFVDPNSTSGNLVPSAEILKNFADLKLTMDDLHTNGKFFKAVSFSGKHQASIQAVSKGDADVAAVASDTLASEVKAGNVDPNTYKEIYNSADIPGSPFAIRGNIDSELKAKIKAFMLSYANADYFDKFLGNKDKRFVDCTIDDYKGVQELYDQLNPK